jgi:TolA-binding protein
MRGSAIRFVCLALPLALGLAATVPGHAQVDSREGIALQNQIYQLRQQIQQLQDQASNGGGGGGGSDAAVGDVAAQLLSRVQALEEQVRQLRGQIDETRNLVAQQNAQLSKRLDDLMFQLNLQGRGGVPSSAPRPAASAVPPPQAREVQPPARIAMPMPGVIQPDQSQRPFTFRQVPQPMREAPRPPPVPPTARVEPTRPVPPPVAPVVARPPDRSARERPPEPSAEDEQATKDGKRTPDMTLRAGRAALARRDYAAAERAAREILSHRASPRAYDGQLLLAQSLIGQKQYAQAAIAFDDTYNRAHKGRHAEEALVGLAGALTAINERRAACDTLGRLKTEFPEVRADLRDAITRTNARAGCGR